MASSSVSLRGVTSSFASFSTRQHRQQEQRKRLKGVVRASASSDDDIENQKPNEKRATTTAETSTAQLPLFDAQIQRLKTDIYALAATTSRGAEATDVQKDVMQKKIAELNRLNPTPTPARSDLINGDWELAYADTYAFRASPFFWQLGKALNENANLFYDAHAHQTSLFGGGVGRVVQNIDMQNMTLTSDCVVKASVGIPFVGFAPIFSGYGSVISKANIIGGGGEEANDRLFCVMESTTIRQDDTEVIPALNFLNNTVVPVGEVFENVVGGGTPPPTVEMKVLYLDEETRVSSLEDGSILLFKRVV
mmetsp:Transcript_3892/g.11987  ORF Transcript_3892/g.11987 Transcript_3892/m.11987 type:complete len:308 (+) Transcript_3892:170-1093(+)